MEDLFPASDTNGKPDDMAGEVVDCRKRSQQWLAENYWPQWTDVFRNYKCEPPAFADPNDATKDDPEQTVVGMPDTWGLVRRFCARMTAQEPSHRFTGDDPQISDRITRTLMMQWDKGKHQRIQQKHVTQAELFGWSVKAWYWAVDENLRKKRVDPLDPNIDPNNLAMVKQQYASQIQQYMQEMGAGNPDEMWQQISLRLIKDIGRGKLVPIEYLYKCYEGPKAEWLFVGDCYPEPNFVSIQRSKWFIVERRRDLSWLKDFVETYQEKIPEILDGVKRLLTDHPDGSPKTKVSAGKDALYLRSRLMDAINRSDSVAMQEGSGKMAVQPEWTFTERHVPGPNPRVDIVAEGSIWIGSIPYPYDLEGQIAFTELVFIDDLLAGIGDSTPRIIRTLNGLHNNQVSKRSDLVQNLLRPLMWTTDHKLYDEADRLKRGKGFRLFYADGGSNSVGVLGEQGALAAAASASEADEGAMARAMQMASGETNMSMASGVDPQQGRTATGARIMAFNGDILTKEQTKMLTVGVRDDLEMMRLLNRSEATEDVQFDGNNYRRQFGGTYAAPLPPNSAQIKATPEDFQSDGDIEVEVGSTLADDDDTKLTRAQTLFGAALQSPQLFNVETARTELLIALGKGKDIDKWIPQPKPQAPPPPIIKTSASIPIPFEKLSPDVQMQILVEAGIHPPMPPPMPGMPPGMPPPPGMGMPPGGGPPGPGVPPPHMGGPPHSPMPAPPPQPEGPGSQLEAALGRK